MDSGDKPAASGLVEVRGLFGVEGDTGFASEAALKLYRELMDAPRGEPVMAKTPLHQGKRARSVP